MPSRVIPTHQSLNYASSAPLGQSPSNHSDRQGQTILFSFVRRRPFEGLLPESSREKSANEALGSGSANNVVRIFKLVGANDHGERIPYDNLIYQARKYDNLGD